MNNNFTNDLSYCQFLKKENNIGRALIDKLKGSPFENKKNI